jgi:hypothetical protein
MNELGTKRICDNCIGEPFLKALVASRGAGAICSYCAAESRTFTVQDLADRVERAFSEHYERTQTKEDAFEEAMHHGAGFSENWERSGVKVLSAIANAARIPNPVAVDVHSILQSRHYNPESSKKGRECEFQESSFYAPNHAGFGAYNAKWFKFERHLKREARFISSTLEKALDEIFHGLGDLKSSNGAGVVVKIGPESGVKSLYRARVFLGDDEKLNEALRMPSINLGPPPHVDASAGRMNACGISVFYGAIDESTALAEVRPPVGSKVVIARFSILRPLQLLDMNALQSTSLEGSIFDETFLLQRQRTNFLKILSSRLSRPVMPHEEALEYLPTQVVAEYLATRYGLDGLIYPSVQIGGTSLNVVLFRCSSRVVGDQFPRGTEHLGGLQSNDPDEGREYYSVVHLIPKSPVEPVSGSGNWRIPSSEEVVDSRDCSLNIELKDIVVHHVVSVAHQSKRFPVRRFTVKR